LRGKGSFPFSLNLKENLSRGNSMYDRDYYIDDENHVSTQVETGINPEEVPPPPVNPFIRAMSQAEVEGVNAIIRSAESLTAKIQHAWKIRDGMRRAIAGMICPWRRGQVIQLNDGLKPFERRVITEVLPGVTEEGEFYRVRTLVLMKGMKLGKRYMLLRLYVNLRVTVLGEFSGVLPEEGEELKEKMIV
jgi:hypothetical protein